LRQQIRRERRVQQHDFPSSNDVVEAKDFDTEGNHGSRSNRRIVDVSTAVPER
jgi:galactose-1-phosphate uridylyltransferase